MSIDPHLPTATLLEHIQNKSTSRTLLIQLESALRGMQERGELPDEKQRCLTVINMVLRDNAVNNRMADLDRQRSKIRRWPTQKRRS